MLIDALARVGWTGCVVASPESQIWEGAWINFGHFAQLCGHWAFSGRVRQRLAEYRNTVHKIRPVIGACPQL
jgi:hypothetical protein